MQENPILFNAVGLAVSTFCKSRTYSQNMYGNIRASQYCAHTRLFSPLPLFHAWTRGAETCCTVTRQKCAPLLPRRSCSGRGRFSGHWTAERMPCCTAGMCLLRCTAWLAAAYPALASVLPALCGTSA